MELPPDGSGCRMDGFKEPILKLKAAGGKHTRDEIADIGRS
jgi:hypothetical protein